MELKKSKKANLENKRAFFLEIGLVLTLAIVFCAFEWKSYEKTEFVMDMEIPTIEEEIIPITRQKEQPPPPVQKTQTQEINIVEKDEDADDVEINSEIDQDDKVEEYIPPPPVDEPDEVYVEPEIFTVVEQMPEFPGGVAKMMEYLSRNIEYPQIAREMGTQGTVFITFVVEPAGNITGVKVLRGIGSGCDEEAIRVVKSFPKWKPGKQRNRPVRVQFNLPVKFILQG